MTNQLNMAKIQSIQLLHSLHWSQRRIADELRIDRETVRKYLECGSQGAKPAISPTGSNDLKPAGSEAAGRPGIPPPPAEITGFVDVAKPDGFSVRLVRVRRLPAQSMQHFCDDRRARIAHAQDDDVRPTIHSHARIPMQD